jgi:hypothetical protein
MPGRAFRFGQCAQVGQRPIAPVQMSASSWQGLLVVPGGAPASPECRIASSARRRRHLLQLLDAPREATLRGGGGKQHKGGSRTGDKEGIGRAIGPRLCKSRPIRLLQPRIQGCEIFTDVRHPRLIHAGGVDRLVPLLPGRLFGT